MNRSAEDGAWSSPHYGDEAEAELHAEISHTREGSSAMRGGKPARRVEIRSPGAHEPLELVDERTVGGERPQPLRRYIL